MGLLVDTIGVSFGLDTPDDCWSSWSMGMGLMIGTVGVSFGLHTPDDCRASWSMGMGLLVCIDEFVDGGSIV